MAKILIVDDRPTNRQFLVTLLGYGSHELLEAADGAAALEIVRAQRPDLVITDLMMPVMDGFEFTRRLRADSAISGTPVIFYTATYRAPEAKALAAACGVRTVLQKPSEPDIILEAVRNELGLASSPPQEAMRSHPVPSNHAETDLDSQLAAYVKEMLAVKTQFDKLTDRMSGLAEVGSTVADASSRFSDNLRHLQRFGLRMATIIETTLDALPEQSAKRALERFFDTAGAMIGSRYAAAGFYVNDEPGLRFVFVKGFDPKVYKVASEHVARAPANILGERGASQVRLCFPDRDIAGFPEGHPPVRSLLVAEIASRDRTHGWLYFAEPDGKDDFDGEDERIAATVATHMALFYENSLLNDLMQGRAAQLQVEIVKRERAEKEAALHREQLTQAQKMEAVGQLTGGIAHDFNNVLTVIKGTVEDLQTDFSDTPGLKDITDILMQAADRGAGLVRQLLAYARKQELSPKLLDMNVVLKSFVGLLRRTLPENISVELRAAEKLSSVNVDQGSIENVFLNLSINARDAMPGGGILVFETRDVVLDEGYAAENPDVRSGPYVMIAVSDTGTGMTKDVMERVFEPFFTTKEVGKGTGLGLSMVYGSIKQSGGHAKIYSELNIGTTIKIYLPANSAIVEPEVTRDIEAPLAGAGTGTGDILVVEDDPLVRSSVTAKLRRMGYGVTAVITPGEALATLSGDSAFDLVFTDIIMPGPMNGADLAREVQRRWPRIKVLATSGYTENVIFGKVSIPPGVRLLSKPYSNADFVKALRETLGA